MDHHERLNAIKERLQVAQDQSQPQPQPASPQEPAPAQPAPAPQPQAPTPAPPPAEPQPPAPPAPPEPDPTAQLQEEMAELRREVEAAKQREEAARQEKDRILAAAQQKAVLPSAEELDRLSPGEAARATAEAMMAQVNQQLEGIRTEVKRETAPTQKQLQALQLDARRREAADAYPGAPVEKYRTAFDKMAAKYPDMPGSQVLKAVADPRDLSLTQQPTTPQPQPQPAAAHMPSGVSAQRAPAQPQEGGQGQPTVRDHLERSYELRKDGDRRGAEQAIQEGTKKRLRDTGVLAS